MKLRYHLLLTCLTCGFWFPVAFLLFLSKHRWWLWNKMWH